MRTCRCVAGRLGLVAAAATCLVAAWVSSAVAHIEVSADNPQAGATDVTLTFLALSEHDTEGIVSLQVVLPPGIGAEDVSWVSGPPGWELAPSEIEGEDAYTVGGPEVPPGGDVEYQVMVARLPADAAELAFRTLQTYGDGHVDRWVELPQSGVDPQAPAPVLTLTPAASPTAEPVEAPPIAATAPPPTAAGQAAPAADAEGSTAVPWIITGGLFLATVAGGLLWWRRRAAASQSAGDT